MESTIHIFIIWEKAPVTLMRFFLIRNIVRAIIGGKKLQVYLQMLEILSRDNLGKKKRQEP